jgi:hypothetical protein
MPKSAKAVVSLIDLGGRFNEVAALQAEVQKHVVAIQALYERIAKAADGDPAKAVTVPAAGGKQRAKRGELKAAVRKLLADGKAHTAAEVVKGLPKVGFKSASKPNVLYNTVYLTMKKDKAVQKTAEGFKLKAPAAKEAASIPKK